MLAPNPDRPIRYVRVDRTAYPTRTRAYGEIYLVLVLTNLARTRCCPDPLQKKKKAR